MHQIKQAIVIEGKFDKAKLASLFDAPIVETGGFGIFSNEDTRELIKHFAANTGIIVLTDSDPAGRKIRAFINDLVKVGVVLNAYVPAVEGKEKRKSRPGAAGLLGVEGIEDSVVEKAVLSVAQSADNEVPGDPVTAAELYEAGLLGKPHSSSLRAEFLRSQGLPPGLSRKQILSYLNSNPGPQRFRELLGEYAKRTE